VGLKKTLEYYQHYSSSHNHWKFKLLRSKFGWAAEGRFWALNNMIALSDDCLLDLNRKNLKATVMSDLQLSEDEFDNFISVLVKDCELLISLDGAVTNEILRTNLAEVMKQRERMKERRTKSVQDNLHLLSKFKSVR
jgi:hypothetical protein